MNDLNNIAVRVINKDEKSVVLLHSLLCSFFFAWALKKKQINYDIVKYYQEDLKQNLYLFIIDYIHQWDINKGTYHTFVHNHFYKILTKTIEENTGITKYYQAKGVTITPQGAVDKNYNPQQEWDVNIDFNIIIDTIKKEKNKDIIKKYIEGYSIKELAVMNQCSNQNIDYIIKKFKNRNKNL
jgi:DNA-directed RNA polymerase specialized sigma24 family protein